MYLIQTILLPWWNIESIKVSTFHDKKFRNRWPSGGKPYAEKSEMSVAKFDFLRLCIGLLIKKVSFPEMAICTISIYKTCCNGERGEGICTL